MRGYEVRERKAEVTRDPEVIQWAVNKEPSRGAGITTLGKPQAGWLFRSAPPPKPEKPNTCPCTWLSQSSMPHLGTPATETQTCSSRHGLVIWPLQTTLFRVICNAPLFLAQVRPFWVSWMECLSPQFKRVLWNKTEHDNKNKWRGQGDRIQI